MPIDMWSLGCILAELYTGYAILPGEDESDQLACIIELLGMPPKQVLENSKRSKIFFNTKGYPRYCSLKTMDDGSVVMGEGFSRRGVTRGPPGSRKLKNALNGCDDVYFLQFISECLEWVPEKRLTPEQAIKHSWFKRRLPKLPQNSGNSNSSSNSYAGNSSSTSSNKQTSITSTSGIVGGVTSDGTKIKSNDSSSTSSSSATTVTTTTTAPTAKGITANCFYYDNTLHQLNLNNNSDSHKSLPSGTATLSYPHHHHHSGSAGGALSGSGSKLSSDKYQDLSNRKSMTLNRLMSSSIHSASTLSLVSSSHGSNNNGNNNGSATTGINPSKLPSLN